MSDVPVYMVVNLHVTNAEEYRVYEKGFFPLLKKYGGTFVTYDDQTYTCLLYTSPSPRDRTRSRMPSSA